MINTSFWLPIIDSARWSIGIILFITYLFGFSFWISIHGMYFFWRKLDIRLTFTLHFIAGFGLAYSIYHFSNLLIGNDLGFNPYLTVLFIILYSITIYLEIITRRTLKLKTLAGVPELKPDHPESKLLTDGIYSKTRNPRYVLVFINLIGWACFVNYSGVYIFIAVMYILIYIAVILEEFELRSRFGKPYIKYCKTVPRFIPKWK